jgi:IclR helix-turn-helix domain
MLVQNDHRISRSQSETRDDAHAWADQCSDFVLIAEGKPPSRIELARERMLICRLYLGLMRTITDDYGAEFAAHSDSLAYRTIGIYVFLRTVMCSPVRASQIAHALKLPRVAVLRRLQEMVKHGYVERVGNAYRVTDGGSPDPFGPFRRRRLQARKYFVGVNLEIPIIEKRLAIKLDELLGLLCNINVNRFAYDPAVERRCGAFTEWAQ